MELAEKSLVPFGRLHIPPREESLTAYYAATSFAELRKTWTFRAYLTRPGTNDLVDLPSVTLTVSSASPRSGRDASGAPRTGIRGAH